MTTKLIKVDGGYQLYFPAELVAQAGLVEGAEVVLSAETGTLKAKDSSKPRRIPYKLEDLLAGITPENCHGEWDVGPPVGKERFWEDE